MKEKGIIQLLINHAMRLMASQILTAIILAGFSAQLISETPKQKISKKEIKALTASATTVTDHERLANYYATQRQHFAEKRREYEARCVEVAAHPANFKTKYPSAYDDCRFWSQYYELKARDAEKAADVQEQLAASLRDGKP